MSTLDRFISRIVGAGITGAAGMVLLVSGYHAWAVNPLMAAVFMVLGGVALIAATVMGVTA